ncbi:MAG: glycosyltransferase family 2 protein [Planctomycetes bacterium]|nr:glycosyltransferase family 2 protein [Planctomycetota bacterium]
MKEAYENVPATVVIVTYASSQTVGNALTALYPAYEDRLLQCIVVDNASPDDTADRVAREHPWVELLRSPRNLGYGRGCNLGFGRVRTPYVLFMNPDVVIGKDAIRELLRFLEAKAVVGIAAPATRWGRGDRLQHAGGSFTPWSVVATATGIRRLQPKLTCVRPGAPPFRTDWLCGAVILVRSEAFRGVGGFDPRFFLYFEETDLCRRLRAAGWELWAVGAASATHFVGSSARHFDPSLGEGDCLSDHYFRSRYYYLGKHYGRVAAAAAEFGELVVKGARDLLRILFLRSPKDELRKRLRAPLFRRPDPSV